MTCNRVKIDAASGIFELEGEADFVQTQLDKLLPLVTAGGFVKKAVQAEIMNGSITPPPQEDTSNGANTVRRAKRRSSTPPKGHSCADRMLALRQDGFFKEQKTPSQIVEGLGAKGWTHTSNQVSAAGGQMFKRGDIQRTKAGNGFAYYWDRE